MIHCYLISLLTLAEDVHPVSTKTRYVLAVARTNDCNPKNSSLLSAFPYISSASAASIQSPSSKFPCFRLLFSAITPFVRALQSLKPRVSEQDKNFFPSLRALYVLAP
ncbi:hypothetical protein B0O99DRAFT_184778 [Bisporella sp. PMI_857]|nr:hypothetical protein B0O99DRAFT_184778 [Bisporella sp. PMI_857]